MIIGQYLKFSPGSFYVLPHYFRTKVYSRLGLVLGLQTTPTTSSYILMQKFILTNVFGAITYIYMIALKFYLQILLIVCLLYIKIIVLGEATMGDLYCLAESCFVSTSC